MARIQSNDRRESTLSLFSMQLAATPILEAPIFVINFIMDEISGACSKLWDRITSFKLFNRSSKDEHSNQFEMRHITGEDTEDDLSADGDYANPTIIETSSLATMGGTPSETSSLIVPYDEEDDDDNESEKGDEEAKYDDGFDGDLEDEDGGSTILSSFATISDITQIGENLHQPDQDDDASLDAVSVSGDEGDEFEYDEDPTGNDSMLQTIENPEESGNEEEDDEEGLLVSQFRLSEEEVAAFADVFAALEAANQDSLLLDAPATSTLLSRAASIEEASAPVSPQRQAIEAELAALRTPDQAGYTPFKHGFNETVGHIVEKTQDIYNIEAFLASRFNLGKEKVAFLMEQFYGLPEEKQAEMISNATNYNNDMNMDIIGGSHSYTQTMEIAAF